MGLQTVGHDLATEHACLLYLINLLSSRVPWWRRQWHPTPVLLPGKSHGRRSLVDCSPWGHEESDMTEWLHFHFSLLFVEGNGNPLQCSCLENPRDGVAQSRTWLKWLSSSSSSKVPWWEKVKVTQFVSDSLWPHGLYSPWNSLGQNTGVGRFSLLQGIFSTQELNPGLPHSRWILYQLSHKGSPKILEWVAYPFSRDLPNPGIETGSPALQVDSTYWAIRETHDERNSFIKLNGS